jgi:ABC-type dipeptide/oligopeptide/nickel transport system ATPase subunit
MVEPVVVELVNMSIEYKRRNRLGRLQRSVLALDRVNMRIEPGARIGLTGPSGAGKSTLARCIAGWLEPSAGLVSRRGPVQLVMQDPGGSLNPRFTAARAIEEPLRIRRIPGHPAREFLRQVGIEDTRVNDPTPKFSGGQRARLALARALAALAGAANSLLILDESLSALDQDTCTQILQLLQTWNRSLGLAYLLVAHDRDLLHAWTDRVVIVEGGRIGCPP